MRDDVLSLIVIAAAGVHIAIESGKVRAGDLDPEPLAWREIVACVHRLECELVNLVFFHPHHRFVVTITVTHSLDRLIIKPVAMIQNLDLHLLAAAGVHRERVIGSAADA